MSTGRSDLETVFDAIIIYMCQKMVSWNDVMPQYMYMYLANGMHICRNSWYKYPLLVTKYVAVNDNVYFYPPVQVNH